MLFGQLDDHLRFDGAVSQPGDDRLLNFGQGPCGGGNLAGVGNINIALLVDRLRRQVNEVTGTRARRLGRRKQSTRCGLEDRNTQDVANPDDLARLGPLVREVALETDQVWLRQKANRVSGNVDQRVR